MALAPCLIGYGAIARRLHSDETTLRDGNQYWKWIENYVADDYTEAVRLGSGKRIHLQSVKTCLTITLFFVVP
jgi:thiaminase